MYKKIVGKPYDFKFERYDNWDRKCEVRKVFEWDNGLDETSPKYERIEVTYIPELKKLFTVTHGPVVVKELKEPIEDWMMEHGHGDDYYLRDALSNINAADGAYEEQKKAREETQEE